MHKFSGTVSVVPPFDFSKTLNYLRWFPPMLGDQGVSADCFAKAVRLNGCTLLFRVWDGATGHNTSIKYELYSQKGSMDGSTRDEAVTWLRFFLGLDDDLTGFYALAQDDLQFAPLVKELYGYHAVKFPSPFEAAAWTILSQRNRMATARNMHRSLMHRFGHRIEVEDEVYWAFPCARELAGMYEGELAEVARNLRRAEYLSDVARAFAITSPDYLKTASYSEVEGWLRGIKGIGPWSSRFILLRGLGRAEAIPWDDRAIVAAASKVYGGGLTLEPGEVQRIASRYGPWQGYWAHYLRLAT